MKAEAEKLQTEISTEQTADWNQKVAQFREVHADYEDVVKSLAVPLEIANSIKEMDNGAEVAYKLAKDPALAQRISNSTPMNVAMILFGLQQQGGPVVQPSVETPQEPVKAPVQATPSTSLTPQQQTKPRITRPSQLGMDDFIKHRLEIGTLRK